MANQIQVNLAVEDSLSEMVLRTILQQSERSYVVGSCFLKGGYGYLKKSIRGFNNASKGTPFLILTDLDKAECPPELIREWLPYSKHPNLIFRIAVREVEAWLLADRQAFSEFIGIPIGLISDDTETIPDPKQKLIELVSKSKNKELREDIVPSMRSTARVGPNYNGRLGFFVTSHWRIKEAVNHSVSLKRTVSTIVGFKPL